VPSLCCAAVCSHLASPLPTPSQATREAVSKHTLLPPELGLESHLGKVCGTELKSPNLETLGARVQNHIWTVEPRTQGNLVTSSKALVNGQSLSSPVKQEGSGLLGRGRGYKES
jgi:hypothetical protein